MGNYFNCLGFHKEISQKRTREEYEKHKFHFSPYQAGDKTDKDPTGKNYRQSCSTNLRSFIYVKTSGPTVLTHTHKQPGPDLI